MGARVMGEASGGDIEKALAKVATALDRAPPEVNVGALRIQVEQCRAAIAACSREEFGPALRGALRMKIIALALETEALMGREDDESAWSVAPTNVRTLR